MFGAGKNGNRNVYSIYCSNKCVGKSKDSQRKREKTYKDKYGENVINPGQLTLDKEKIKQTCLQN